MKSCKKCGEIKPATEFNKHTQTRDGLRPECKACESLYHADYRAANTEKTRAAKAKWNAANKVKIKAACAKYYADNIEKCKANIAKWSAANPDKTRAAAARWRASNPEKKKAINAKWKAANLYSLRLYQHNRRAIKRESGGKLTKGLAERLFKLQRGKCACCGVKLVEDHMDHVIPLALGGPNEDWNMQLLCPPCNLQKGAKHPVDYMQSKGFLI